MPAPSSVCQIDGYFIHPRIQNTDCSATLNFSNIRACATHFLFPENGSGSMADGCHCHLSLVSSGTTLQPVKFGPRWTVVKIKLSAIHVYIPQTPCLHSTKVCVWWTTSYCYPVLHLRDFLEIWENQKLASHCTMWKIFLWWRSTYCRQQKIPAPTSL